MINDGFSIRGEVDRSLKLQEVVDREESTPSILYENEEISQTPRNNGSDLALSCITPRVCHPQ